MGRSLATTRFGPPVLEAAPLPASSQTLALLAFMKRREALRRSKADGGEPPWSTDEILAEYKFTNVKREHDRTSVWMREHMYAIHAPSASAGLTVFNAALFRIFGTVNFASLVGWTAASYDADELVRLALDCRQTHGHAFTSAYCLPFYNAEISGEASAQRVYERVCRKYLQAVWDQREQLGAACASGSWRTLVETLRETPGFGGSGFMAKEVALDVMSTPHLRDCIDRNEWCPMGPGARRGLNRLHGRPTMQAISVASGDTERRFLAECRALHQALLAAEPAWCAELEIELHDVQFQLCEFDKYTRIRLGEPGRKTKYRRIARRESEEGNDVGLLV